VAFLWPFVWLTVVGYWSTQKETGLAGGRERARVGRKFVNGVNR